MEDTKKELERLQKALLADETMIGEDLTEDLPDDLVDDMDDAATAQLLEDLSQEVAEATQDSETAAEEEVVTEEVTTEEEAPIEEAPSVTDETLIVDDAMLDALLAEVNSPDFDNPDAMGATDETMVFHNFSNDYGKDLDGYGEPEPEEEPVDEETKKRDEMIVMGLMIGACTLCLGILGLLIYWLVALL